MVEHTKLAAPSAVVERIVATSGCGGGCGGGGRVLGRRQISRLTFVAGAGALLLEDGRLADVRGRASSGANLFAALSTPRPRRPLTVDVIVVDRLGQLRGLVAVAR